MFNQPEVHMKKTFLLVLAVMFCVSLSSAQYTNDASFPSDTLLKAVQTHGVTVDPAGKVWVIPFSLIKGDSVLSNGVNRAVAGIRVYNANGTKASFSPLSILVGPVSAIRCSRQPISAVSTSIRTATSCSPTAEHCTASITRPVLL